MIDALDQHILILYCTGLMVTERSVLALSRGTEQR